MKNELFNAIGDELARGISIYIAIGGIFALLGIVFLQSALDKLLDFAGNKAWLNEHFGKSPLKNMVGPLLVTLTIFELIAGSSCVLGFFQLYIFDDLSFGLIGLVFCTLSLLALMFGQRIAKDYAGAGGLVPYFIVVILGFIIIYNL